MSLKCDGAVIFKFTWLTATRHTAHWSIHSRSMSVSRFPQSGIINRWHAWGSAQSCTWSILSPSYSHRSAWSDGTIRVKRTMSQNQIRAVEQAHRAKPIRVHVESLWTMNLYIWWLGLTVLWVAVDKGVAAGQHSVCVTFYWCVGGRVKFLSFVTFLHHSISFGWFLKDAAA